MIAVLKPKRRKLTAEIFEGKNHEWYWRLKNRTGQIVAIGGEGYKTRAGVVKAIKRLAVWCIPANYATLHEVLNFSPLETALHDCANAATPARVAGVAK